MSRALAWVGRWYSLPLLLICWQVVVASGWVTSILLPSLGTVLQAFVHDVLNGALPLAALLTVERSLAGFLLSLIVGVPLALGMARSAWFGRLLEPTFFAGYPVPKIAFYPIFTFIFGIGTSSKISFTFLEALYPIVVTTYVGVHAIQTRLVWSARNFGAGPTQILYRVLLRAALPDIFSGIRIALPIAITVTVVTEMIGGSSGLGYYITIASARFRYQNVYAGILTIGLCGFLFDWLVVLARRIFVYWERPEA
jgi:NitT/TauT family transport system permease protein